MKTEKDFLLLLGREILLEDRPLKIVSFNIKDQVIIVESKKNSHSWSIQQLKVDDYDYESLVKSNKNFRAKEVNEMQLIPTFKEKIKALVI